MGKNVIVNVTSAVAVGGAALASDEAGVSEAVAVLVESGAGVELVVCVEVAVGSGGCDGGSV